MKKVKTSAKGRICRYHHCRKIISIYNHEQYCHVHQLILLHGGTFKTLSSAKT